MIMITFLANFQIAKKMYIKFHSTPRDSMVIIILLSEEKKTENHFKKIGHEF